MNDVIQALPVLLGGIIGVVGVLVWGRLMLRKARRHFWSRGKGQLLRPPGYSLSQQLSEHWHRLDRPIAAVFIGGGIVGAVVWAVLYAIWVITNSASIRGQLQREGWSVLTSASGFWPTAISMALGFIGGAAAVIWGAFKFRQWLREEYRLRIGLRGEQAVAEELQPAMRAGYYLFNDVPTDAGCNVDHVLVGPAGVFALETKARAKPDNPNGRKLVAEFDGQRLSFTGGAYDEKATNQAEAASKSLAGELSRATGRTVRVMPVVVVPGWFVPRNDFEHVIARNPEYLAKELRDAPRAISDSDIEAFAQQLEKRCRDVEV